MIPRYSVVLLMRNLDLLLKIFLYVFVLMLICVALIVAVLNPITDILNSNLDIGAQLQNALSDFFQNGINSAFTKLGASFSAIFRERTTELWVSIGLALVIAFVFKFLLALTHIPATRIINGRMSQNYSLRFRDVIVQDLGKSLLYSVIYSSISFVAELIVWVFGLFLARVLSAGMGIYAYVVVCTLILGLSSMKFAILSQWLPLIVCEGMPVAKAFGKSFALSKKCFWRTLPLLSIINILLFSTVTTTTLFTMGILPVLILLVSIVLICSLNLVTYYVNNKKKFYVDEVTVVNQPDTEDEVDV